MLGLIICANGGGGGGFVEEGKWILWKFCFNFNVVTNPLKSITGSIRTV